MKLLTYATHEGSSVNGILVRTSHKPPAGTGHGSLKPRENSRARMNGVGMLMSKLSLRCLCRISGTTWKQDTPNDTLSDNLEDEPPPACCGVEDVSGCNSIAAVYVTCARVFTVYSNEATCDAIIVRNFGSAQLKVLRDGPVVQLCEKSTCTLSFIFGAPDSSVLVHRLSDFESVAVKSRKRQVTRKIFGHSARDCPSPHLSRCQVQAPGDRGSHNG
ncbi:hypothetical protein EDD16DRAFT_571610 [Pisolithus croceorrhizus]|nr:hypothetical protein EDD16DRAFT_571610 [Pisolithus croceorrhizus]